MPSLAVVALPIRLKRSAVTVTSARSPPPVVAVEAASSGDDAGAAGSALAAQVKQIANAPTGSASRLRMELEVRRGLATDLGTKSSCGSTIDATTTPICRRNGFPAVISAPRLVTGRRR